jgi:energy-coupling factor transporter ATP-binding protein EcfA2
MSEWQREKKIKWPSRQSVWTMGSFYFAFLALAGMLAWQYMHDWTSLQRYYLPMYANTWKQGNTQAKGYKLLYVVNKQGQEKLALDSEIEVERQPDGKTRYMLLDAATNNGWVKAGLDDAVSDGQNVKSEEVHSYLRHWIYQDQTVADYLKLHNKSVLWLWAVLFIFGLWKDGKRAQIRKRGQHVRGPELVSVTEFNRKSGSDGIGWANQDQRWLEKQLEKKSDQWMRIPRAIESNHLMIMGDTGSGKSALIRQLLMQIEERGETAIVYDPSQDLLSEFFSPERGDRILNPQDSRCPYWEPGDEIQHPAEANTVANSLFQEEREQETKFFVEAPRRIFAHLLNLKPTPEELIYWMAHEEEIDKRVKGTELAAMINPQSANQRNGVMGSLNMVANSFKLLPSKQETTERWSAREWAKEGKGWIFLTSKPEMRKQLLPLTSLWLDLLVLRLNQKKHGRVPIWMVLDELASLQRLPQLHTALTENRKSGNPVVIGFQGKSQLEKRYGQDAETMLSQPSTKIFLKTSEPIAAEWASKAIGDVEQAYLRETTTQGQLPQSRHSVSQQVDTRISRLVMASQISGLAPLHGYMKLGNLVVPMHFPYLKLKEKQERFIERNINPQAGSTNVTLLLPKIDPTGTQQIGLNPLPDSQQHYFE